MICGDIVQLDVDTHKNKPLGLQKFLDAWVKLQQDTKIPEHKGKDAGDMHNHETFKAYQCAKMRSERLNQMMRVIELESTTSMRNNQISDLNSFLQGAAETFRKSKTPTKPKQKTKEEQPTASVIETTQTIPTSAPCFVLSQELTN